MTTDSEWRTDRPEVGRLIVDIEGIEWRIQNSSLADAFHERAQRYPDSYSWQYIDRPPEMVAAAEFGAACAWVEVFARVVVPLGGAEWRTDRPAIGRHIETRDGRAIHADCFHMAWCAERDAEVSPSKWAWRYID